MSRTTATRFGKGFLIHTQKTIEVKSETIRTTSKDGKRELKKPVVEITLALKTVPHDILVMRRSSLKRRGLKVPAR